MTKFPGIYKFIIIFHLSSCLIQPVPIINPTRTQLENLLLVTFRAENLKTPFDVPGDKEEFSESEKGKGFFKFEVFDEISNQKIELQTYREKQRKFPTPKAIVIFQHGINSHVNGLAHLAKFLANQGIESVGFDQRGYGKSKINQNDEGLIKNFQTMTDDSISFLQELQKFYPKSIKRFMLGESMGGMNTLLTSLKSKELLDGLIVLAPAIEFAFKLAQHGQFLLEFVTSILPKQGQINVETNIGAKHLSVAQSQLKDPYHQNGHIKFQTANEMIKAMKFLSNNLENIELPFLLFHGGADKLISWEGSLKLFEKSRSKDKTFYFYQKMWHDIIHEEEIYQILPVIGEWIKNRI